MSKIHVVAMATLAFIMSGCGQTLQNQTRVSAASTVSASSMLRTQIGSGQILVKFAPRVTIAAREQFQLTYGLRPLNIIEGIDVHVFQIMDGSQVLSKLETIRRSPLVSYAEPNQQVTVNPIALQ